MLLDEHRQHQYNDARTNPTASTASATAATAICYMWSAAWHPTHQREEQHNLHTDSITNPTTSTSDTVTATAACCMRFADFQNVRVFDRGVTGASCLGGCDRGLCLGRCDRGSKDAFCRG